MALVLASIAALSLTLLLAAAPAGAFISGEFGLQQRKPVWVRNGPLQYHAGPVIHASDSYAIYWDPLELYNSEWMQLIDKYFRNVGDGQRGLGNVFALNSQYGETGYSTAPSASEKAKEAHASNQSTFRGPTRPPIPTPRAATAPKRLEIACLTDAKSKQSCKESSDPASCRAPRERFPARQTTPVYYILTPPGVTVARPGPKAPTPAPTRPSWKTKCKKSKKKDHASRRNWNLRIPLDDRTARRNADRLRGAAVDRG